MFPKSLFCGYGLVLEESLGKILNTRKKKSCIEEKDALLKSELLQKGIYPTSMCNSIQYN